MMHRTAFAIVVTLLATEPAAAQAPPRPPQPYAPVAITRPPASDDAGFVAFRGALAAAARTRIYADLAPLVRTQGFFWDRDFERKFDSRRPAVDNLASAVSLEHDDGAGWNTLAAFAKDAAVEPLESRPGVVCAPARPGYDSVAFARLLDVTDTSDVDWAYPHADATAVSGAPLPDAAVVGTLGANLVRLLGFEGAATAMPGRRQWAKVALPDGKTGYVAPGHLVPFTAGRLCYVKELVAGWRIAGVIGAERRSGLTQSGQ